MNKSKPLALLAALSIVLLFARLGASSVFQVAEARNAECAREMMAAGNWVVPLFNGKLRTDKPVLEYLAMIAAYRIGGVSEASARFFSAVCGLLLVLATFWFVSRHLGRRAAWWSGLCLLASPHLVFQFRLATPDPYLILADTLALYAFFEGWTAYRKGRPKPWRWYGAFYLLAAMAVLAKGPVGLLLPALTVMVFLLSKKGFFWRGLRELRPWWGAVLLAAVAAPWYVAVDYQTQGAWTRGFFLGHNLHRFGDAMGGHGGPFLVTFLFVAAGMLPFSVLSVHATCQAWKKRKPDDLRLFSLIAAATVVVFYAISRTKLINYTVPAYPFLAILTGGFIAFISRSRVRVRGLGAALAVLAVLSVALPAGIWLWTRQLDILRPLGWAVLPALLYPLGAWMGVVSFRRGNRLLALSVVAAGFITATAALLMGPYPAADQLTPIRRSAALLSSGRPVAAYRTFNNAFVFYLARQVAVLEDTTGVREFLNAHPGGLIITREKDPAPLHRMGLLKVRDDPEVFNSRHCRIFTKPGGPKDARGGIAEKRTLDL